ncbi:ATP-grasp domain-containing protein [Flavicella sediminum]|uniref:ATP-grasp domain-containing protein n=1 Tax=Flavicella sediminum TaxID=2585141 RepID=UPI00140812C9|nr:ATP-grasp domain-containing protein [Flavicella sediminum]
MMKKNILVFPCGSEIGLEIHRSLKYSRHLNLIGGSSVEDHGKFIYNRCIENIPFYNSDDFISKLKVIIEEQSIDAIYPTMDAVISKVSEASDVLGCLIIGSPAKTNTLCSSKLSTYSVLRNYVNVPMQYTDIESVSLFPVFMKPDVGYGSRGAKLIEDEEEGINHLKKYENCIILENLPGKEYTVDCFTDKNGELLFARARERKRIMKGISVNTIPVSDLENEFSNFAKNINKRIEFRGAWFFQVKKDVNGELSLLEVASRIAGSSALFRNTGVNLALLSVFDAFGYDVSVFSNKYDLTLDRALSNKYKINIEYQTVYVDFDDCLLLTDKVNTTLIAFLYQALNENKSLKLITKHSLDIKKTLSEYRLLELFDEIIHLKNEDQKYKYMKDRESIFIDDSHVERFEVYNNLNLPVFSPDAVESLLN